VSGAEGLVVRPAVAPGSAETLHAALAEQARGDRLAAVAVLAAGSRLSAETPAAQRLLLAGLYREAGLLDEADAAYTALAAGSDAAVRLKAEAGLAAVALDRGEPQAAADRLTRLAPPPGDPVSVTVNDLLIRAYLATGQGLQATRLLPAEERDPFVAVNRATAFMAIGDTFSAVSELKAAARAASRSVPEEAYLRERILLALGTLYGEQGRLDEALSAFAGMSPRGPLADRMRFGRGLAFHHHGDRVKAIAEFQGLERDAPDSPYALEGMLIMADAYRELNAPRRAVAEYRKALERFQERARAAGFLKDETERMPFDQGLTGLIFSGAWREPAAARDTARYRGLAVLFRTPGFAALFDDYRQVVLTVARLEGVNARLQGRGQTAAAGSVTAAVDRMGVFRSLIEAAARRAVLRILQEERERMEDASLTASLGITQSILFDRLGEDGRELYFREGS